MISIQQRLLTWVVCVQLLLVFYNGVREVSTLSTILHQQVEELCDGQVCCQVCCDIVNNIPEIAGASFEAGSEPLNCKDACETPTIDCQNASFDGINNEAVRRASCEVGKAFVDPLAGIVEYEFEGAVFTFCCLRDGGGSGFLSSTPDEGVCAVDFISPTEAPTQSPVPNPTEAPTEIPTASPLPAEETDSPTQRPSSTPTVLEGITGEGQGTDEQNDIISIVLGGIGGAIGCLCLTAVLASMCGSGDRNFYRRDEEKEEEELDEIGFHEKMKEIAFENAQQQQQHSSPGSSIFPKDVNSTSSSGGIHEARPHYAHFGSSVQSNHYISDFPQEPRDEGRLPFPQFQPKQKRNVMSLFSTNKVYSKYHSTETVPTLNFSRS